MERKIGHTPIFLFQKFCVESCQKHILSAFFAKKCFCQNSCQIGPQKNGPYFVDLERTIKYFSKILQNKNLTTPIMGWRDFEYSS